MTRFAPYAGVSPRAVDLVNWEAWRSKIPVALEAFPAGATPSCSFPSAFLAYSTQV